MFLKYNGSRMRIKLTGGATSKCPVTGERDYYTWQMEYTPRDKLVEVTWLRGELERMRDEVVTCEELAVFLRGVLDLVNPHSSQVTVWDDSDGIQLEVKV